ncbi:hypothetical protein [Cognatiluteimonas telluris]|uniref:hypothetical protein n=1 Tax=Cognatiluteimonas telluris TaxID=1104775 RepID=UPI001407C486|nr:hypothetical protein [Lysobacter telluris]
MKALALALLPALVGIGVIADASANTNARVSTGVGTSPNAGTSPGTNAITNPADNPTLDSLFRQDQADRDAAAIDWQALAARDAARRAQVGTLLDRGEIRSAADHYHAAMVLQHGQTLDDFRLANALATIAVAQAPGDAHYRWLAGASWDRLLMRQGQAQWYGTQYKGDATRGLYLYPVAEDAVTDAQRKAMVGHTLQESRDHVAVAAKEMNMPVRTPPPTLEELRRESATAGKDH